MLRAQRQMAADLSEQELATLDALLDEPESEDTEGPGAGDQDDLSHDSSTAPDDSGAADPRRVVHDVLVALDGPLGAVDESRLAVGDSDSFEALINAREVALRAGPTSQDVIA
jgi:hypothetical protein